MSVPSSVNHSVILQNPSPGPKTSAGLDAGVDVDFAGASWCTWPHSRPCLLCRLHLIPVTCLPRFLPSSSLHSLVLSALFHGSPVPAAVLSCCARAGLAAHQPVHPPWGRKVSLLPLMNIDLCPASWRVRSQGGALGRSQAVTGTWLRFFDPCAVQGPAAPCCAVSHQGGGTSSTGVSLLLSPKTSEASSWCHGPS